MELQITQSKRYEIKGYKVMLDSDLAQMYGVEKRHLFALAKIFFNPLGDMFIYIYLWRIINSLLNKYN